MSQLLDSRLERRGDRRYRFDQPVQFSVAREGATCLGAGHTVDLGAGGVLFETDRPLHHGERVELQIPWPVLAQDVCPVMLVIQGIVVRTDPRGTALRMRHYAFHMAGGMEAPSRGAACNLVG